MGEIEDLRKRLAESDAMLRRSLEEKGAMVLARLEEEAVRAIEMSALYERDLATGLLRHGSFRARLDFEIERSERTGDALALILADIDDFSRYNQRYGYEAGDRALSAIGRALLVLWEAEPSRRPPVLARDAGDGFAVLLPGTDGADVWKRAEAIRDLVDRLPLPSGRLTASVGGAWRQPGCSTASELLAAARAGLSSAHEAGGNRYILCGAPLRPSLASQHDGFEP
jgi:diguanylate cyclase (GGDEF)-like protein